MTGKKDENDYTFSIKMLDLQFLLKYDLSFRIYGNSISVTQTGRISMYEPNLQNVAKDYCSAFKCK